jgi:hypothetical protein
MKVWFLDRAKSIWEFCKLKFSSLYVTTNHFDCCLTRHLFYIELSQNSTKMDQLILKLVTLNWKLKNEDNQSKI